MLVNATAVPAKFILRVLFVVILAFSLTTLYILQTPNHVTVSPSSGRQIESVERHCLPFEIGGHVFDEHGLSASIDGLVTSCLLHSFSPYIEREAAKRFLDPSRDNVYFANSPAITWHNDSLVLVARIWLDRERYEAKNNWPANHFADNWLYTQRFSRDLRPVSDGAIIGIPAPKQWWVGDGPIEPRLLRTNDNRLFATFNVAMAFQQGYYMDFTVWFDVEKNMPIIPDIDGGSPMVNASEENDMPRDKHWMSFVERDNDVYFVHNLDPLRILRCNQDGHCHFVQRDELQRKNGANTGFIFRDSFSHLRGGTPFELYRWPYYISVAHTTMYKKSNGHRFYTGHLILLCVRPTYRVVYVSDAIQLHRRLYRAAQMVRSRYIDDGFMFPVGLIVESDDSLAIGAHVNDHSSIIIRLKGLRETLDKVISLDQKDERSRYGPPLGFLQQYIHDSLVKKTNVELVHKQ